MKSLQLFCLLSALLIAACSTPMPTASQPAEFKLSAEDLRQQAKATRSLGIVDLYADKILTSQDEKGETFYLATGQVQLVKKSSTPIRAKAEEILLTSAHAEVRGQSILQKADQLYFGETADSKILIDGVQILPQGPHSLKRLGNAPPAPASVPAVEANLEPEANPEAQPAPEAKPKPQIQREPAAKPAPKPVTKPKRQARTAAKPKITTPPPATNPAAAAPKPTRAPIDRTKLLQLMREPE